MNQRLEEGLQLAAKGQVAEALAAFDEAVKSDPGNFDAWFNLGVAMQILGQYDRAAEAYRRTLIIVPQAVEAYNNLGLCLFATKNFEESLVAFNKAIALKPEHIEAVNNRGLVLQTLGRMDEAIAAYRQTLRINPKYEKAHCNLGNALFTLGRIEAALDSYDRALALNPGDVASHNNRIYTLLFHTGYDALSMGQELRLFNDRHCRPLAELIQPHGNKPVPDRVLRIGYVSGDFRSHAVGWSMLPLLSNHDREKFHITCYANFHTAPDQFTEKLRAHADEWRDITGIDDDRAAQMVRKDQIDILVDLSLHTAGNRLLLFARKPAPIQATYLGYPGSTGLTVIDYRIGDPYIDPPGTDRFYVEQTLRLPHTYLCWRWGGGEEAVRPPPSVKSGQITFGCLNNFSKTTPATLEMWGQVLSSVNHSRLIMRCPAGETEDRVCEALLRHEVSRDRLEFVGHLPWDDYVEMFHGLDIVLDPYPYSGHTSSCDAIWMGVPLVTLAGVTPVGRGGVSILNNIGEPDLVARSVVEYVRIATELAANQPRLIELRQTLREKLRQSPIMNAPAFARDMESAYRKMWKNWCEAKTG